MKSIKHRTEELKRVATEAGDKATARVCGHALGGERWAKNLVLEILAEAWSE